jgi:hypothetical protein
VLFRRAKSLFELSIYDMALRDVAHASSIMPNDKVSGIIYDCLLFLLYNDASFSFDLEYLCFSQTSSRENTGRD